MNDESRFIRIVCEVVKIFEAMKAMIKPELHLLFLESKF